MVYAKPTTYTEEESRGGWVRVNFFSPMGREMGDYSFTQRPSMRVSHPMVCVYPVLKGVYFTTHNLSVTANQLLHVLFIPSSYNLTQQRNPDCAGPAGKVCCSPKWCLLTGFPSVLLLCRKLPKEPNLKVRYSSSGQCLQLWRQTDLGSSMASTMKACGTMGKLLNYSSL